MKIKRNVEIPKNIGRGRLGEVSQAIVDFMESEDTNLKFECGGKEEANRVNATAAGYISSKKLPLKVIRSQFDIYVLRKAGE